MNRKLVVSIFLFALFLAGLTAPAASAMPYHPWANEVVSKMTFGVWTPQRSLSAPDGQYARISIKTGVLTLDLGKGQEGYGDLLIYHKGVGTKFPVTIKVEFLRENLTPFYATVVTLTPGEDDVLTVVQFHSPVETAYRYIRLGSVNTAIFVDAVQVVD